MRGGGGGGGGEEGGRGRVEGVRKEVTHVRKKEGGGEGRVMERKKLTSTTVSLYHPEICIPKISIYGQTKNHFL